MVSFGVEFQNDMFTTAHVVIVTLLLGCVHSALFGHVTHYRDSWSGQDKLHNTYATTSIK